MAMNANLSQNLTKCSKLSAKSFQIWSPHPQPHPHFGSSFFEVVISPTAGLIPPLLSFMAATQISSGGHQFRQTKVTRKFRAQSQSHLVGFLVYIQHKLGIRLVV